mmetsp:Transcript_8045/g.20021  ORF Transcript_8045/g.20021 Transcript_8045/m.20021 type:complete len:231 (-) Transcript_8045:223-915(-)
MEALQALIRKKDALEAEAESLTEQLSASNMGGVSGPLVDREGFPRADVDVHATRLLRNRLACLNTDHRQLMGQIEQSMHALHAAAAADGTVSTGSAPAARSTPAAAAPSGSAAPAASAAANGHTQLKPFALVDSVDPAGPAAAAGLQVGDRLLRFGALHAENHDQLKALGRLTQRSVGGEVAVIVLRAAANSEPPPPSAAHPTTSPAVELCLRPCTWDGPGLLGCHLTPL